MPEQSEFDGSLIIQADRGINWDNPDSIKAYLQTPNLSNKLDHFHFPSASRESFLSRDDATMARDYFRRLAEKYGQQIAEIIVNGKLKISLLIDSPGGQFITGKRFLELIRMAKGDDKNNTTAYVTNQALSLGALICQEADIINSLPESVFMWHAGRPTFELPDTTEKVSVTETEDLDEDLDNDQMFIEALYLKEDREAYDNLHAFLQGRIKPGHWPAVEKRLALLLDTQTPYEERSLYFTGAELAECGVVNACDFDELQRRFEANVHDSEPFRDFFETSREICALTSSWSIKDRAAFDVTHYRKILNAIMRFSALLAGMAKQPKKTRR